MADKEPVLKPERKRGRKRTRTEGKPKNKNSGEGAASALATWREIERIRVVCEPDSERPIV